MSRHEFTAKIKVLAFERSKGRCEICTAELSDGNIEYDHEIPDALGGGATLENCLCVCKNCHQKKTSAADIPLIAKAKRVQRKAIGIRKMSRFACSRNSPWKKRLDGRVVRR